MSDPRKNFMCSKCGIIINDLARKWGDDTPCENCIRMEYEEKIKKEEKQFE